MSTLLALGSWLGLGIPTAAVFWRRDERGLALAVLPFAGALAILLPAVAALWRDGDLGAWPLQAGGAALLVAAVAYALLIGAPPAPAAPAEPGATRVGTGLALGLLILVAAVEIWIGASLARGWPGYHWDGLVIWLVRAKVLAASQPVPLELFREPELQYGHWDYPLALPALLAWFLRVGGLEVRQLAIPLGLLAAVIPLATAVGLARVLRWPLAAAVALAPLAVPDLLAYHHSAYADGVLVMVVIAGLAWTLAGAIRWDRGLLAVGGIAFAVAVSVKNEGVLWLCASAPGLVLLSAHHRLPVAAWLRPLLLTLAPGLVLFAFWRLTCAHLGTEASLVAELRWDLAARRFAPLLHSMAAVLSFQNIPILLGCGVAMFALVPGRPRERPLLVLCLLSVPVSFLAGLFLVYLATPHELMWHLETSLTRTLFGVTPAVFAATVLATALPRKTRRLNADAGRRDRR